MVLGGMGNLPGAFVGGIVLGALQGISIVYAPAWLTSSNLPCFLPRWPLGASTFARSANASAWSRQDALRDRFAGRVVAKPTKEGRRPFGRGDSRTDLDPVALRRLRRSRESFGVRWLSIGTTYALLAIVVSGNEVIWGLGGLPSLGYNGFMAVGAYTAALLTTKFGFPQSRPSVLRPGLGGLCPSPVAVCEPAAAALLYNRHLGLRVDCRGPRHGVSGSDRRPNWFVWHSGPRLRGRSPVPARVLLSGLGPGVAWRPCRRPACAFSHGPRVAGYSSR